jgi:hypothetical protein
MYTQTTSSSETYQKTIIIIIISVKAFWVGGAVILLNRIYQVLHIGNGPDTCTHKQQVAAKRIKKLSIS